MKRKTKIRLLAMNVVAIIVVLAAWYFTIPRQRYNKLPTLREIKYTPPDTTCAPQCRIGMSCADGLCIPGPPPPVLTFTFSGAIAPGFVENTMATLKSFVVDPGAEGPSGAARANTLVYALLAGGGVPFVPERVSPSTISTNTTPSKLDEYFLPPLTIKGVGEMWFALPVKG